MIIRPIVAYIAYEPYGLDYLEKFLKRYNEYPSGYDHELMICFKQFRNKEIIYEWKKKINVKFTEFDDSNNPNDFDIGSYFRIAKKFPKRHILFLDTHTRPNCNNWLKIYVNHYKENSLLGATGSMSSLSSQFLKFFYNGKHSVFQQIRWGIHHLKKVQLYPNPHIRTTAFFLNAKDLLSLDFDTKKFVKKIETNYFEGGRDGLSNKLLKKGFKLLVVNSDDKSFDIPDWKKSQTFYLQKQEKLIFIDNRTEEYHKSNEIEREKMRKFTWGKN